MNWFQRHLNWTWVFAYLIWIPLNASESVVAGLVAAVFLLISIWLGYQTERAKLMVDTPDPFIFTAMAEKHESG